MKFWIEISSEFRLNKKISLEEGLYAPAKIRYINMMEKLGKGDIILHYITSPGAKSKINRN